MSVALLSSFRAAMLALREALDGSDAEAIETASARLATAVSRVRAQGAWLDEPALREELAALGPLIEAARVRISFLADQTRQRIALLAERGVMPPLTYSR